MRTKKNIKQAIDYQSYLKEQLQNPEVRRHYEEAGKQLEVAYQILQLRKARGISQKELAKKLGTTQGNIARIEAGKQNFTTSTLYRIAKVLDRDLHIKFV